MRTVLLLFFCFVGVLGMSQTTFIPDDNFEQALIDQNYDDVLDNEVLTANIQNITFLNLTGVQTFLESLTAPGLGITDLTGIKAFTSLEILWVQQNDLTQLDLEGMTTITDVRAFFNDLEQLNIQGLSNLEIIGLNVNNLSGINVSTNTALRVFDVAQNNLLDLDISGLTNLTGMNVENNPQLSCIQVESAARATSLNGNANFRKNGTTTFSNTCPSIYTQIPDRNFETFLIANGIDTEGGIPDGLVLTADITDELSLIMPNQGITDLTGLEAFTALEILDVSNNDLNELRLQNLSLVEIYANNCNLAGKSVRFQNNPPVGSFLTNVTTLELQNNNLGIASSTFSFGGVPNVQTLNVSGNNFGTLTLGGQTDNISNLIASNCPNLNTLTGLGSLSQLQELTITNSNFTSLDFSGLDLLSTLRVNNNDFESLNLKDVDDTLTNFNATGNANLSCIEVNNVANAEGQGGWQKDAAAEYRTDCSAPEPFTVTTDIEGAGTTPNFDITEGNSFTLNFNADATAQAGTQYTPNITFTLNGAPTTEDFAFNGNTALPTTPFRVTANNPDGTITIVAVNDGTAEPDEIYTITLNSPDPSLFTMVGETSFEVRVKDIPESTNEPLFITTSLSGAGNGPYYEVDEGLNFQLQFDADDPAIDGSFFSLEITYTIYNIVEQEILDDLDQPIGFSVERKEQMNDDENPDVAIDGSMPDNSYAFNVKDGSDGVLNFSILDDDLPEETEEVIINIKSTNPNVTISNSNRYILKILRNDPTEVEVILKDVSVTEGNTINLVFNELPNDAYIDYIINESSASKGSYSEGGDFSVSENGNILSLSTWLDALPDENEQIIIQLPQPIENYTYKDSKDDGSLDFTINIRDGEEFEVVADIEGATFINTNFYEINEGEPFSVTLNPVVDDLDIVPNSFPVEINTNLGSAELGVDFILVSNSYPDIRVSDTGKATYKTIIDGVPDEDELIIITLPKPKHPYKWHNAETMPDGSLQFTIRVKDQNITDPLIDYSIKVAKYNPETEERTTVQGNSVTVSELDKLEFSLESENFSDATKGISINSIDGTATLESQDFNSYDLFQVKNFGFFQIKTISFNDSENGEPNENFFIEISPTTSNYRLFAPDNNLLDLNQKYILEVIIEDNSNSSSAGEPQIITDIVVGGERQLGDIFSKEYSATPEKTVEIFLNDYVPNSNEGKQYQIEFEIDENASTIKKEDYNLTIVNEAGNNLINDNGFFDYIVNQNNVFDAKINISLNEGVNLQLPKTLVLSLIPNVTIIDLDAAPDEFIPNAVFYESVQNSSNLNDLVYKFTFSSAENDGLVFPVIRQSGGVEGLIDKPDTITCTLENGDGTDYTEHTDIITIPFEFSNDVVDGIAEQDIRFSSMVFEFQPGENTATITATYLHEQDEIDAECNYYELRLKDATQSAGATIVISDKWKLMKVADYSEFLVFVDLQLKNVQPSIANLRFDDPNYIGDCTQCIAFYKVEENSTIKFDIDAAQGVPQARNTTDIENAYILDLNISYSNVSNKASPINLLGNINDPSQIPIYVDEDEIDKTLSLEIGKVTENESFDVIFNEPEERKTYRFSQRESRTYGDTFEFRIINVVALEVGKNQNQVEIDEENPMSFGEILIEASDNESFDSVTAVHFTLDGTARHGAGKDYMIISEDGNSLQIEDNKGVVYFRPSDTSVKLKVVPVPDNDDERIETIKFILEDKFGYSVNNSFTELTIIDDDRTDYEASITSTDEVLFENRTQQFTKEIEFKLTPNNAPENNIQLNISFDEESTATFNEDFKLYEIREGQEDREILTAEGLYVTVPINASTAKLLIQTVEDKANEVEAEGNEQVRINLEASDQYFAKDPKSILIEIRDEGDDGAPPPDITSGIIARVTSSSCDSENNGRISMKNGTDREYMAILYTSDGETVGEPEKLEANIIEFSEIFKKLAPDTYTIFLSSTATDGEPQSVDDALPPSFTLTVKTADEVKLIQSTTSKQFKSATLRVSGSYSYQVDNNGKTYTFDVGSTTAYDIAVPLQYGQNNLRIKGDSECQGIIKTSIVLDNIIPYPNPSTDLVYITGFEPNSKITIHISAPSGRLVARKEIMTTSSTLEINLTSYSKGVYLCQVRDENGMSSNFKLVKK